MRVGWVCVVWSETHLKHLKHLKVVERQRFTVLSLFYVCFMFYPHIKHKTTGLCLSGFYRSYGGFRAGAIQTNKDKAGLG